MKHAQTLLAVAFVATSVFATAAMAQTTSPATNKADPKQAMPAPADQKPGAAPTVKSMGDNAQRQHDPNRAATGKGGGGSTSTPSASVGEVRDWAKIDTNKDNLISADEMEKYLADSRTAKPATAAPTAKN